MSTSYNAYTAIGLEFDRDELFSKLEVQDKDHSCLGYQAMLKDGTPCLMRYCPDCGAEVVSEEEVPISDLVEDEDVEKIGPFQVLRQNIFYDKPARLWVCSAVHTISDWGDNAWAGKWEPQGTLDLEAHRSMLKKVLEPLGIWDDDKFGMWTILDAG